MTASQWYVNGTNNNSVLPKAVVGCAEAEQEAAYYTALKLVARIDEDLARGIRHYRDQAGRLRTQLDEVIRAILTKNLLLLEEEEGEV